MSKWIAALTIFAGMSAQAGELTVEAMPGTSYVLPISRQSCHQQAELKGGPLEVAGNSFEIGSLAVKWKSENAAQVSAITVEFNSHVLEGGQYQCVIEGKEMETVLSPFGHVMTAGNRTHYSNGFCGVRCGGVKFIPEVKSATITGTLKVVAYELNNEGRFIPVTAETPVALEYSKW